MVNGTPFGEDADTRMAEANKSIRTGGLLAGGRGHFVAAAVLLSLSASGCSSGPPEFAGVWASSDGTPDKVISADGRCSGMYYNNGQLLDIGGPMSCTFGEEQADGSYVLVVQQPPNQTTYTVTFRDADTMEMQQNGQPLVVLTRR